MDARLDAAPEGARPKVKARDRVFQSIARGLFRVGIRPNHLTIAQVPIYFLMARAGLNGDLLGFALWQVVVMALDGMDGTLARRMGLASRSGAILDAVFDMVGIVLVVVVAAHVHPGYAVWLYALLVANLALYAQNWWLDEKAVSYVRGPVVLGMYFELRFPGIFWFGILVPLVASLVILVTRVLQEPAPPETEVVPGGRAPYKPGFSLRRGP